MRAIATQSPPLMPAPSQRRSFRQRLLRWFDGNRRELPWRADRDPYHVWISEIMLQQTRVAVVRDRYADFLRRFPSVERLAAAKLPEVLAAWSGLGYYRRARALHAAAQHLVEDGLRFPRTVEELASLPGIGRYTAAAIASIAFDQPCAVVDGNVERVLGRLFRVRGREAWRAAGELLSPGRPGDFNQAMMELGAIVCLPKAPLCVQCPVFAWCRTRGEGASQGSILRRKEPIAYRLAVRRQSVFLVQREDHKSLMPGMWELPQTQSGAGEPVLRLRHAITSTDFQVSVYRARTANGSRGRWVNLAEAERLPLTGLTQKILRRAKLI
jgi:A/G-specific adenine glycosylase